MVDESRHCPVPMTFDYFDEENHIWHQYVIQSTNLGKGASSPRLVDHQRPPSLESGQPYRIELYCPECFRGKPRRIAFDHPAILYNQSGYVNIPDCRVVVPRLPLDNRVTRYLAAQMASNPTQMLRPEVPLDNHVTRYFAALMTSSPTQALHPEMFPAYPEVFPDDFLIPTIRLAPNCRCVGVSHADEDYRSTDGEPRQITRTYAHFTAPRPGGSGIPDRFKVECHAAIRGPVPICSAWTDDVHIIRDVNLVIPDTVQQPH